MSAVEVVPAQNGALSEMDTLWKMAVGFVRSGLYGFKKPDECFALLMVAHSEGKHPATAVQEYDIVNGKPSLKASAMLARFQAAGGKIKWVERTDTVAAAYFIHDQADSEEPFRFTMEDAKRAGITGNPTWKKYPRQMLSARVISEGVRATFPGCLGGAHLPGEAPDLDPIEAAPRKDWAEKNPVAAIDQGDMTNRQVKAEREALLKSIEDIGGPAADAVWDDETAEGEAFTNAERLKNLPEDIRVEIENYRKEHVESLVSSVPF